ncbi:MAG TPA: formyltetrahydrofolate deformylase [Polyangiaceae bacterium]|jgi:formyltetrahydrofolate deformylase|nr:formyltetrahydrofolate deformylase [Polyangiaceae bacterium]
MGAPSAATATLLVSCKDQRGIVAALAQLLYGHGANILDADQHTDVDAGQFFQRIRFDMKELHTDRVTLERGISEVSERFGMTYRLSQESEVPRVAVFVSKYDHCLYDLLLRHRAGEFRCEIALIVSNHPDLEPVARQFGIAYHVFPITADTRKAQERAELELLASAKIDLVVLARYMQILSADMVHAYPQRIINIHHSFLPAFVGQKPYHQAHDRGVKLVGATAHYVTAELDEGPIIHQDVVHTSHRDSVTELVRKGRDLERNVLSTAVRAHLDDRILVYGNRTVVFR